MSDGIRYRDYTDYISNLQRQINELRASIFPTVAIGPGISSGSTGGITAIVQDTNPKLGGNLDCDNKLVQNVPTPSDSDTDHAANVTYVLSKIGTMSHLYQDTTPALGGNLNTDYGGTAHQIISSSGKGITIKAGGTGTAPDSNNLRLEANGDIHLNASGYTYIHYGKLSNNLDAQSSYKVIALAAPSTNGDSIRQTTKITEAHLESAIDAIATANAAIIKATPQLGGDLDCNTYSLKLTSTEVISHSSFLNALSIGASSTDLWLTAGGTGKGIYMATSAGPIQAASPSGYGISIKAGGSPSDPSSNKLKLESAGDIYLSPAEGSNTKIDQGLLTSNLAAGGYKVTGLGVPASSGDAIRQTATITETALASVISNAITSPLAGNLDANDHNIVNVTVLHLAPATQPTANVGSIYFNTNDSSLYVRTS